MVPALCMSEVLAIEVQQIEGIQDYYALRMPSHR
jgi:hypothetical protein